MQKEKSFKYRLYPTDEQKARINQLIGACRFVYNAAVRYNNNYIQERNEQIKENPDLKLDFADNCFSYENIRELNNNTPWLKELKITGLTRAVLNKNVFNAYERYFKRLSKLPTCHKKTTCGSFYVQLSSSIDYENEIIRIPNQIGKVKFVYHRPIFGEPTGSYVTISRNSIGEYYFSFSCKIEVPKAPKKKATNDNTIGIDMGVAEQCIVSDGEIIDKYKSDPKIEKRIKKLQRKISKQVGSKKGEKKSNNYIKTQKQISKLQLKIARQRELHQYTAINTILSTTNPTYIGVENLNVKGMSSTGKSKIKLTTEEYNKLTPEEKKAYNRKKKRRFNKSVSNASIYSFKTKLINKADEQGRKVIEIPRFYGSTQICSNCGYKNTDLKGFKALKIRKWVCPNCGTTHNRDINAAENIKNKAIEVKNNSETTQKNLGRCYPEVKPVEILPKETVLISGIIEPMKQENLSKMVFTNLDNDGTT